jgi:hypothetical protein
MRDDFAVFILTHRRPNNIVTDNSLNRSGYTGKRFYIVDDTDTTLGEYRKNFGDKVLTFNLKETERSFDIGDNFRNLPTITHARNASFTLAKKAGLSYFIQLDDDYTTFTYGMSPDDKYLTRRNPVSNLDNVLEAMVEFLERVPYALTLAMSQGGDWMGGPNSGIAYKALPRKAMNTFVCATDRPFTFVGRLNEDVNTYTTLNRQGKVLFTYPRLRIEQKRTQSSSGGITETYKTTGTYAKSFYTTMYAPSCTTVTTMGKVDRRIHHQINWTRTAPKILHERHRKTTQ